ncbi:MAG TPA: FAD-binding oxidoreductase [Steroidobacteraceae bacterium]|nr:FAD-binding oxidoreductase [Steroidobacteraceae bacterium]
MQYDFIVVGAGIAGASVACELARRGTVCLIEAESRPGFHATGRSAALFAPSYGGREIRAVTRASRAFFDRPPSGFCEHPLLTPRGCLYIARSDQSIRLHQMVDRIRATGGTVGMTTLDEAMARVPLIRAGYLAAAAFDADAMDIDVDALHQGFLRSARAAGARLLTGTAATRIDRRNGLWSLDLPDGATRADGSIRAPVLINAAGAWADEVAGACGARRIGLQPLRRTALLIDPPAGADVRNWPAVIDADEEFYFKPDRTQLLLSPADEIPQAPGDAQPEELDVAIGVERVQSALAIDVERVSHRWAGLRTFAPDRVPVIGYDPDVEGMFWCAGQGGYGIQTAPAMARIAAALIERRHLPADVEAEGLTAQDLSPHRFHA